MNDSRVKVFIGSGEASLIERKVAIYSLRKNTKRNLDIYVCNGTQWQSTGWRVKESNCVAVDSGSAPPTEY